MTGAPSASRTRPAVLAAPESPPARTPGRWWLIGGVPVIILVGIALLFESTGADLRGSAPFADPVHGFPLKDDWFFADWLHEGGRKVLTTAVILTTLAGVAAGCSRRWRGWCVPLLYLGICVGLGSLATGILKATTNRYSPWSITAFGGQVPWTTLFAGTPAPFHDGRSFPAGHAAPAFALVALAHLGWALGARRWWWWALPGLLLGALFGWTQQVRGAHFLSHNLWSLAIAWAIATGLAWLATRCGAWGLGSDPAVRAAIARRLAVLIPALSALALGLLLLASAYAGLLLIAGERLPKLAVGGALIVLGPGAGLACGWWAARLRQRAAPRSSAG